MVEPAASYGAALVAEALESATSSSECVVTTPPSPVVICLFG